MFDMAWQPFLLLPRFHGGPGILQDQTFALWSHVLSNIPMTDPAGAGIYANMTGVKMMGSMAHHIYQHHGSVMGYQTYEFVQQIRISRLSRSMEFV